MIDLIARVTVFLALTCVPLTIMVAFVTDKEYRNPFVFLILLFFTYIGVSIWIKAKRKK